MTFKEESDIINEAMNLTSDKINSLTEEQFRKYLPVMANKVNTQAEKYINSTQFNKLKLERSPFYKYLSKVGKVKIKEDMTRQEMYKEFAKAKHFLSLKRFTITEYKEYRKELKDKFTDIINEKIPKDKMSVNIKGLSYRDVDDIISGLNHAQEKYGAGVFETYSLKDVMVEINEMINSGLFENNYIDYEKLVEDLAEKIYKQQIDRNSVPDDAFINRRKR